VAAVGTLEWERAGGPGLTLPQRFALLGNAAVVVAATLVGRIAWRLRPSGRPPTVDLARWAPPDSSIARHAEQLLREVASPQVVNHSFRAYYFSAVAYELSGAKEPMDREGLYVAALMHDVSLAKPRPQGVHCFTVAAASEARRLMASAGWDEGRQDKVALAVVANLNVRVPLRVFGAEAHYFTVGGMVEVLAQEWKVSPGNLAEILGRYPRTGYLADILGHVAREAQLDPGGRFACLGPIFPGVVRRARFDGE